MLVQHLLTERLFRTIFDNPDFVQRNVIAQKVETVIAALVSQSFNRAEFLKSLDKFYRAIELAAETISDFQGKQHFLNSVYERFFQSYSVKTADTHGVRYTPQPIVDFMCASVERVLEDEFGLTLGSPNVNVLDPCTGTGNFVVNLLNRVPGRGLPDLYASRLFANEVMLLPYYIAAMNIEHAYYERTGSYDPFEGLCFVDTLDMADGGQPGLPYFTERNAERVERQRKNPITIIVGTPPYNVGQLNENDNNKNRRYAGIDKRVRDTYAKASAASSVSKLNDQYVRFFRWASDRLKGRDGIVCFVSNNSFVDQIAFDGMRKHLLQDFTLVYHLDLGGNVRQNPKMSGTQYNVFGIQVGVGITIAVKAGRHTDRRLLLHRVDTGLRRYAKLKWLGARGDMRGVPWEAKTPDARNTWLVPTNSAEFSGFIPIGNKEGKAATAASARVVFKEFSLGVVTARDSLVYDFDKRALAKRMPEVIDAYNGEVDRYARSVTKVPVDSFVKYESVKWSRDLKADLARGVYAQYDESKIRGCLYRPFTRLSLFYDEVMNEETRRLPSILPPGVAAENRLICVSGVGHDVFICAISDSIIDYKYSNSTNGGSQCFPFFVYDVDGTNRRENITDWALGQFRDHYLDGAITKWDIFHYVYGVLHHPGYRRDFSDSLKRELPRVPFAPDFRAFAAAGREMADLHLSFEELGPYPLDYRETLAVPLSYAVEDKMRLSKDKTSVRVNKSLELTGIPPEVFDYRLGNRSALEWVIDQYQVTEDARSGIRSDPNRPDDPEYIVNLVGQVVKVSLETVKIVAGLPKEYSA